MKCGRIKRMLSAYVDDELTGNKRAFVESHTSRCPACRQELSDFKKGHELLSRKDFQTAGPLFLKALTSRIGEKREETLAFDIGIWIRRLVPVASALALISCGLLVRNIIGETPPVTVESVIAVNGVSPEERIINSEEKIANDTVLRLVAYHPSGW